MEQSIKKNYSFIKETSLALIPVITILGVVYFLGKLSDFYEGEDFLLFKFANNYPYWDSIKLYFLKNARPVEAIYWAGIYKVFGYAPAIDHLLSYVLHLGGVVMAGFVLYRAWLHQKMRAGSIFAFIIFLFFLPHAVNSALYLNTDNSRLSILFWLTSIVFMQEWAKSSFKPKWVVMGFGFFLIAIFTYDIVIFLFPAAILAAIPFFPTTESRAKIRTRLIRLFIIGMILSLIPFFIYSVLQYFSDVEITHPAFYHGFSQEILTRILQSARLLLNGIYSANANLEIANPFSFQVLFLWFAAIAAFALLTSWSYIKTNAAINNRDNQTIISLGFAGVWVILFGLLPFFLAYPSENTLVRYYSASIYGIGFLFFKGYNLFKTWFARVIALVLLLPSLILGPLEFNLLSNRLHTYEQPLATFFLSIKKIIPNVRDDTVLLFIDPGLNITPSGSCARGLTMLYNKPNLECAFLSYTNEVYRATREEKNILAYDGLWDDTNNWIFIITHSDGSMSIVPEINPKSDLLIDWISVEPLYTNYGRIRLDKAVESQMYRHLIAREQVYND